MLERTENSSMPLRALMYVCSAVGEEKEGVVEGDSVSPGMRPRGRRDWGSEGRERYCKNGNKQ